MEVSRFWAEYFHNSRLSTNCRLVTKDGQFKETHQLLLASVSRFMETILLSVSNVGTEAVVVILPDFTTSQVEELMEDIWINRDVSFRGGLAETLDISLEKMPNLEAELKDEMKIETVRDMSNSFDDNIAKYSTSDHEGLSVDIKGVSITKEESFKRNSKPQACEYCGKSFRLLETHITTRHREKSLYLKHIRVGKFSFTCEICKKEFKKKQHCLFHLKRFHKIGAKLKCESCPKLFYDKNDLNMHTLVHTGIRNISCELCSKRFATASNLKMHHRQVHLSEEEKEALKIHVCLCVGKDSL